MIELLETTEKRNTEINVSHSLGLCDCDGNMSVDAYTIEIMMILILFTPSPII